MNNTKLNKMILKMLLETDPTSESLAYVTTIDNWQRLSGTVKREFGYAFGLEISLAGGGEIGRGVCYINRMQKLKLILASQTAMV